MDTDLLYKIVLLAPPMLLCLTVHEYAHARVALAFGDPTAAQLGRVSLNPLRHLDLVGTIAFIVTQMVGWGKPVPVNPFNLRPQRLGDAMVSLAGPLSNVVLAAAAGVLLRLLLLASGSIPKALFEAVFVMLYFSVVINLAVCIFNLTPLFPLDGHHILREMLPPRMHEGFMRWQMRYGVILMVALWVGPGLMDRMGHRVPDPLGLLITPVVDGAMRWIIG